MIRDSVLRDTLIDEGALLDAMTLEMSIVGRWVKLDGRFQTLNVGDSSTMEAISDEEQD